MAVTGVAGVGIPTSLPGSVGLVPWDVSVAVSLTDRVSACSQAKEKSSPRTLSLPVTRTKLPSFQFSLVRSSTSGHTITSSAPDRSSTLAMMNFRPSRVSRVVVDARWPTTDSIWPFISSSIWWMEAIDPVESNLARSFKGLCDKDTPRSSRSHMAFSWSATSGPSRIIPGDSGMPESSLLPPNMLVWPESLAFASIWAVATTWSRTLSNGPRPVRLSKAPAFTRHSSVRRFKPLELARRQKSSIEVNGPFFLRSSTMGLTAASPTDFMTDNPMRRPGFWLPGAAPTPAPTPVATAPEPASP